MKEADLKLKDFAGISTDGAQTIARKLGRLKVLIKCVSPRVQSVEALFDIKRCTCIQPAWS